MSDKLNRYKIKKNININKIKEDMADDIIKTIREDNLDIDDIALNLGMSVEELTKMILNPKQSHGSELFWIENNVSSTAKTRKK